MDHWDERHLGDNGMIPVRKNGKWGAIDTKGRVAIPPEWDFISWVTRRGQAIVMRDGKFGVIDTSGAFILPLEWDDVTFITDMADRSCPFSGEVLYSVSRMKAPVKLSNDYETHCHEIWNHKCWHGIADYTGAFVIEPVWDSLSFFSEEIVIVVKHGQAEGGLIKYYGAVELGNRLVVQPIYRSILPFTNGFAWVQKTHKWGLMNTAGEFVYKPQWTGVQSIPEQDGYYKANRYGGWGVLRYDGRLIVDFQWDDIRSRGGRLEGKKNKKWEAVPCATEP